MRSTGPAVAGGRSELQKRAAIMMQRPARRRHDLQPPVAVVLADQKVHVLRGAAVAMRGHRMAADEEKLQTREKL